MIFFPLYILHNSFQEPSLKVAITSFTDYERCSYSIIDFMAYCCVHADFFVLILFSEK